MSRRFRSSERYYDAVATWLFFGGIAVFVVGMVLLTSYCDDQAKLDCERKGGQYVHVYKSALCVKKGSVIE